ncbi:MAG: glutamate--tRNA ligase [Bacteroidia bacterium]|nr:glutamate--tRNA ligase [Bacteroidia bacterium]
MENQRVRVRFAPSPTGGLHMGGVRTALFNYLFAKKHGGDFILRIEDTDQTRFVEGAEEYIINALKWCGIEPNEGVGFGDGPYAPYRQSERKASGIYQKYADQLIASGHAYYAFDSSEELDAMRKRLEAAKVAAPQYNAVTRQNMRNSISLSEDEVKRLMEEKHPYVIRLKVPRNEEIRFHDIIRGWVVVNSGQVDDKVLLKSDGMPTYHLAHIVDDIEMKISHAVRGEEWLPSAPAHILIYRYLGLEEKMPKLAHLPLILNPDGHGKISKREARFPVFPLSWSDPRDSSSYLGYKEAGYYPEAFINVMALLGWNPGNNQEVMSMEEMISLFSFERVNKAGAKFDPEKTKWFNQQYLKKKSDEELAEVFIPQIEKNGFHPDKKFAAEVCRLVKEKAHLSDEFWPLGYFFFIAPDKYDEQVVAKRWNANAKSYFEKLTEAWSNATNFSHTNLEAICKEVAAANNIKPGEIMQMLRVMLTGVAGGPALFETAQLLGKEETIKRMESALSTLPV